MKIFTHTLTVQNPIGNLYRKNHVLILLKTGDGRFVLAKKQGFYPEGISRMFGGGIDEGEDPKEAARREMLEETQIDQPLEDFMRLCQIVTNAQTSEGSMSMNTYVYCTNVDVENICPSDDVNGISILTEREFEELISVMYRLTGNYKTEKFCFDWKNWGEIYGCIHEKTFECIREKV